MKILLDLYKTDRQTAKLFTAMLVIEIGLAVVMSIELIKFVIN